MFFSSTSTPSSHLISCIYVNSPHLLSFTEALELASRTECILAHVCIDRTHEVSLAAISSALLQPACIPTKKWSMIRGGPTAWR